MKKRLLLFLAPVVTLVLELLPWGAVLLFANPEGDPWRQTTSYFDLLPFGYANFGPLLTAIFTCIFLLLLVIYCLTGKGKLLGAMRTILVICTACSLLPLLYGVRFFSLVGALISISFVLELWVLERHRKSL